MALQVYKSGQGYWTRVLTAISVMIFALGAAVWFNANILIIYILDSGDNILFWQAGIVAATALLVGGLLWMLLNKPKIADFMIATENEMKKVNWPTRQAIIALTWVVICGTFMIAAILFIADLGFSNLFIELNILDG